MKATFFNKPIEWNIETQGEAWNQGSVIKGVLKVKNHGTEAINLTQSGVALAHADIKKIHAKKEGALKLDVKQSFTEELKAHESKDLIFSLELPANCAVTDKKASYFLAYGRDYSENHLMLKIEPRPLFGKIVSLMDTFHRFKLKEFKTAKNGVEYKLLPPTSREMANIESLALIFSMQGENLHLNFDFQVRKLDMSGVTTKMDKQGLKIERMLIPKEYSLGKDMIDQDRLLKCLDSVLSEVKLKSVF